MKATKSLIGFLLGSLVCFIWVYNGYKRGKEENEIDYKRAYSGKVFNAFIPEDEKFLKIIFYDSTKITLNFWGLRGIVHDEDSIKKEANSFKFIVYKNSNPNDSIVYIGTNFYTK